MSLREITKDLHQDAERTVFAKKLLSGSISKEDYTKYLYNMLPLYDAIEWGCKRLGYLDNMPTLPRLHAIFEDFRELDDGRHWQLVPSTIEYHNYLIKLYNDPNRRHLIKAHMYCRHMGDLFGGQIIAGRVPGSGKFYQFENAEELKQKIRAELTDDLGDEARVAFEYAIKIMRELNDE